MEKYTAEVNKTIQDNINIGATYLVNTSKNYLTWNNIKLVSSLFLALFLASYVDLARPKLPRVIMNIFEDPYFRLFVMAYIMYTGNKDPCTSIMIAFTFLVIMHIINKYKVSVAAVKSNVDSVVQFGEKIVKNGLTPIVKSGIKVVNNNVVPVVKDVAKTVQHNIKAKANSKPTNKKGSKSTNKRSKSSKKSSKVNSKSSVKSNKSS